MSYGRPPPRIEGMVSLKVRFPALEAKKWDTGGERKNGVVFESPPKTLN